MRSKSTATYAPPGRELEFSRYESLEEVGPELWNTLWNSAEVPSIFGRYEWAEAWYRSFGQSHLLRIYTAWSGSHLVGLIPLAMPIDSRTGRGRLIGDPHSDYAAILTDSSQTDVFPRLVDFVSEDSSTFQLAEIRSDSSYAAVLRQLATLPLAQWQFTGSMACPRSSLSRERLEQLINKQSLKRHARKLAQRGSVETVHETEAEAILPRLEGFYSQHISRWQDTGSPSLFLKPENRRFYTQLVKNFSGTGLLVYTEVRLEGNPVACHLGFVSEGDFIWYKPSFDPALSALSPGETLLRELLIYAADCGLTGFDFTRGGEAFKRRFADCERSSLSFTHHSSRATAVIARSRSAVRGVLRDFSYTPAGSRIKNWVRKYR